MSWLAACCLLLPVLVATGPRPVDAADRPQSRLIEVPVKHKPTDKAWTRRQTRTIELLDGFSPSAARIRLSKYGGRLDRKADARGFFYTKKVGGRWYLVDPQGCLFINLGVCSVNMGRSSFSRKPALDKFGTPAKWAEFAAGLLARYGFNGIGGWSDYELLRSAPRRLVYTISWNFMGEFGRRKKLTHQQPGHLGYPNGCIPVFDPEFEEFCDDYARQLAATRDDPWLLGHFSDNELPVSPDLLDRFLGLDRTNPHLRHGFEAARRWLETRKGLRVSAKDITDADRQAFVRHVFERYFRITTAAIRKYDPNHLCLGPRLHGAALRLPQVFGAAAQYLDVIAVNYYGAWTPDRRRMATWAEQAGKPILITEFYAKGADSGLANNSGAGWLVPTQLDRGRFYQNFTLALLESRLCVGWHWFKFRDNNPLDTTTDPSNRDSNKGIVDYRYRPYTDLLDAMAALNNDVYALADYFDTRAGQ